MHEGSSKWRRWLRVDIALTIVAVVAGTGGALLASRYLEQRAADAEAEVARRFTGREVVVAATDVPRGSVLGKAQLALRSVPQTFLPADALPPSRAGMLLGATTAIDVARGTPIVPAMLASVTRAPRLSEALAPDERALTVAVDELNSQAGGLRTGDRVDLYYGRRTGSGSSLVPLLQQVEILGVGDSFHAGDDSHPRSFATVTLRVAVKDAPRVLLAQQSGELSMLLRNPADTAEQPVAIHRSSELLRAPVTQRASGQIELLIGGEGEQVPVRRYISVGASRGGEPS
ncbi:MAG: Flp pilus assembly protein CpaB [Pseudomonadota bacterium]|jgi:pilus assembly protein CpaB|nr:MAG: Flp pilus assembly protein CpaB [Pseudomonadota bacterium]